jgi:bacterioferritin
MPVRARVAAGDRWHIFSPRPTGRLNVTVNSARAAMPRISVQFLSKSLFRECDFQTRARAGPKKSRRFACVSRFGPIVMKVMKGSQAVIDLLNDVLTGELTAVNQYWVHARMCQNWGYERLWHKIRAESIDEMKHADQLVERILFLGGMPNLQRLGKIQIGETVKEQLDLDLGLERDALRRLSDGISLCTAEGDHVSRELLEHILVSEEEHVDWLETQLELMRQIGPELYMSQQIRE